MYLVVVHVDALQLQVGVTVVGTSRVNAVLIGDDLPELGADLVAALATLDVNELTHCVCKSVCLKNKKWICGGWLGPEQQQQRS